MTAIFEGIDGFARAMNFHVARQNMIAANVANVDTPGYAPRELVRPDRANENAFSLNVAATNNRHITAPGSGADEQFEVISERNAIPGNDLNFVSLEHEMSRLSANSVRFQAVTRIITKHLGILHYAARDGR